MNDVKNILIGSLLFASSAASGAIVEYDHTERQEWFNDVGGAAAISTVDFTGYSDFTPITDQWAHLGVHFSGFVVTIGESFITFPNDGWGVRGEPDINMRFDKPIYWVAADFPGQTTIDIYMDDQLLHSTSLLGGGGPGHFGGVISDMPFNRVRFYEEDNFVDALDNIYFGPPIAVPGPGALAVVSLGAVVCSPLRRRKRRR